MVESELDAFYSPRSRGLYRGCSTWERTSRPDQETDRTQDGGVNSGCVGHDRAGAKAWKFWTGITRTLNAGRLSIGKDPTEAFQKGLNIRAGPGRATGRIRTEPPQLFLRAWQRRNRKGLERTQPEKTYPGKGVERRIDFEAIP